jgi:hypothetical protein
MWLLWEERGVIKSRLRERTKMLSLMREVVELSRSRGGLVEERRVEVRLKLKLKGTSFW